MEKILSQLQPRAVWDIFEQLCNIPHPSKHEEQIRDFVAGFFRDLGLETLVDEAGNVIARKPATKGLEHLKGVILQGHLDMVPQKNNDTAHDFIKDPIRPVIDGEWVKASGTTLGSDNGIGVAAAMAVMQSSTLRHGPVEVLLTVDEETGMSGAFGLKPGLLKGDILLNLDSEDEGELYIGCAGGLNSTSIFHYSEEPVPAGYTGFQFAVKGLKGGHSGVDIALGRGNSNKILNRLLKQASRKFGVRLSSVEGGGLRNAIPRESFAVVALPKENERLLQAWLKEFEAVVRKELSGTEPDLKVEATPAGVPASLIDKKTQDAFIHAIYACPNAVIRMSTEMSNLVETSTNLAIVRSGKGTIEVTSLLRSSVDSAKADLAEEFDSVFTLAGAETTFDGEYPGWKPNPSSPILKTMKEVYEKKYGKTPDIRAIHAGLECGLLGGVYPNLDMVSFGPTIRYPHSPDEKVNIETVQKFWDFLVATLENIPAR